MSKERCTIEQLMAKRDSLAERIEDAREKGKREDFYRMVKTHARYSERINALSKVDYTKYRYDASFGCNSKQWWVYDNYLCAYIDPPKAVLDEIDSKFETFDYDAISEWLSDLCNNERPDWLNDVEYTYFDELEI